MPEIKLRIKTQSNLLIGGMPRAFEIGGIDQYTLTDPEGLPIIPASSFKGALRQIVRDNGNDPAAKEIEELYRHFLMYHKERALGLFGKKTYLEEKQACLNRYEMAIGQASAEYLFGIQAFNNTPKLIFTDLLLLQSRQDASGKEEGHETIDLSKLFSLDAKNAIDVSNGKRPTALPRLYKTARSGLFFEGRILFHRLNELGNDAEDRCDAFLRKCLMQFNEGIYRLGNSKSRGYGWIKVETLRQSEVKQA